MPLTINTVAPYAPQFPRIGGVVGGKAIVANGGGGTHSARFIVIDIDSEGISAYQMTAPTGYSLAAGRFGSVYGDALICGMTNGNAGAAVAIVKMFPDGDYETTATSGFVGDPPQTVRSGSRLWVFSTRFAFKPLVYDLSTGSEVTTTLSDVGSSAQAVANGAGTFMYVPVWGGTTIRKINTSTWAHTTLNLPAGLVINETAQVQVRDGKAYWPGTSNRLVELDLATDTITGLTVGVQFASSLLLAGDDGIFYGETATAATIVGWDPSSGANFSESTGVSGASNQTIGLYGNGKRIFPFHK